VVRVETVRAHPVDIPLTHKTPRPYLHIYAHSNELEEVGVVSLTGVNVENDPHKELLLGVRPYLSCYVHS
jgi:hypothetical protein